MPENLTQEQAFEYRLLPRLILALLAERVCERIRPTRPYAYGGCFKVNGGPWRFRRSATVLRRPWEARPAAKPPSTASVDLGLLGTVTMHGPVLRVIPEDEGATRRRESAGGNRRISFILLVYLLHRLSRENGSRKGEAA